jgi:SAM-dependent methyltransferase
VTAGTAPDYDVYARNRPHFFGTVDIPRRLSDAIGSCTGTFVDVGAGDGSNLYAFRSAGLLRRYAAVWALDVSETRIRALRHALPEVTASVGDALRLPFEDGSVGFYFSDQVIEHVPDDRAMAAELARVLAPGGRAFIGSVLRLPGAWYFYRCNGRWALDPTHVREYPAVESYCDVFRSAGLVIQDVFTKPMTFPICDVVLRLLIRAKAVSRERLMHLYAENRLVGRLRGLSVAIPRYHGVYALVTRGASSGNGRRPASPAADG